MALEYIRDIPASNLKILDELVRERYPMFPNYIARMIKLGAYVVVDDFGKRLPTERALEILKNESY